MAASADGTYHTVVALCRMIAQLDTLITLSTGVDGIIIMIIGDTACISTGYCPTEAN